LGKRNEIVAKRTDDFRAFMEIVTDILARKYSVAPTHTANEMELLSKRFPENIKLFAAYKEGIMLAGVAVYDYKSVAHAQYIASSEEGQKMGAGELIMDYLIDDYSSGSSKRYFDFGISTEQGGRYLNAGLSAHKEGFGGRTITYDAYEVDVANTKPSEV
jgi:lipid II:glycine glycyltransferase (peptidoglycan interpeptide bridge formation enzyme)